MNRSLDICFSIKLKSFFFLCNQIILKFLIKGTLIYKLRGIDADGDRLQFGVRDQLGSDILRIESTSANEANIFLAKELDREVRIDSLFISVTYY